MTLQPGQVRIGTSGWHYAHWRGSYYPPRVSFCMFELGPLHSPFTVTADHVYVRLHGPRRRGGSAVRKP